MYIYIYIYIFRIVCTTEQVATKNEAKTKKRRQETEKHLKLPPMCHSAVTSVSCDDPLLNVNAMAGESLLNPLVPRAYYMPSVETTYFFKKLLFFSQSAEFDWTIEKLWLFLHSGS